MFFIGICFCLAGLLVISIANYDEPPQSSGEMPSSHYEGLIKLKLAPNSPPRIHTEGDIDTGVGVTIGDKFFLMYESRNWHTADYGGTFLEEVG